MDDIETLEERSVEEQFSFNVDFKDWQQTLSTQEHTILTYLIQGYPVKQIAEILHTTYQAIRTIICKLKQMYLEYFRLEEFAYP